MKFVCERYPNLKVWDGSKVIAEFVDGIFETNDELVIEVLKKIPEVQVQEVQQTKSSKGK